MNENDKTYKEIYSRYDGRYGNLVDEYCRLLTKYNQVEKNLNHHRTLLAEVGVVGAGS